MELLELLESMVEQKAPDLILKVGARPTVRVRGGLLQLAEEELTRDFLLRVVASLLDDRRMEAFVRGSEVDLAYEVAGLARFRVNVFHQMGMPAVVFRHINAEVPTFAELNLPAEQLIKLASLRRGLVLTTGVAGSGKSTTLAAMIEHMNLTQGRHIVTIEDPVEFLFTDKQCVISQREIGSDSADWATAIKYALRQAPDVIVIGEMRDRATVEAAVNAAETGHLVLSTFHTINAVQTVERILSFFPEHQHQLVRLQLSMVLSGVVSLRLLNSMDGQSRIPAVELLLPTPTVREMLKQGRTDELPKALAQDNFFGTMTFAQSLQKLYTSGKIAMQDAVAAADNPDELKLAFAGVSRGL
ncbi:MAG: PilT/PilU family type 4a pilus ATPase [Planctomycetes bacterium]|nr:PilT/PilU family type 4a pilus ATPase [Planctomycetota bacterium]